MSNPLAGSTDTKGNVAIRPRVSSPTTGPTPQVEHQTAPNIKPARMLTSATARDQESTPTAEDLRSGKKRVVESSAQLDESKTQVPRAQSTLNTFKQSASNSNSSSCNNSKVNTGTTTPNPSSHDLHTTIQALRQQLYISEQHTLQIHQQANHHIHELETLVHTSWARASHLEANINYLAAELEKANGCNATLNEHVLEQRREAERKEAHHKSALRCARTLKAARTQKLTVTEPAMATATTTATTPATAAAPVPRPAPFSSIDSHTQTLLEHNRTTIRVLRAEIRALKSDKKNLQNRLFNLHSPSSSASRGRKVLQMQNAGLAGNVLVEWADVLLERDREIEALKVLVDREREGRKQAEREKCEKCGPTVVVVEDDGEAE